MGQAQDSVLNQLQARLQFMRLDAAGRERIARLKSIIERELPIGLDRFYEQVGVTPEAGRFFSSKEHMRQAKGAQIGHWSAISTGNFDERYASNVRRIGQTHAKIGLEPRWYIGGYALILEHLIQSVISEFWPKGFMQRNTAKAGEDLGAALSSLVKAVLLDMDMSISVYLEAAEEARVKAEADAQAKERRMVADSIGASLKQLAANNLTYRMTDDMPEAYRQLQSDFNAAIAQFESAISEVANGAIAVASATNEIASAADDLSKRTEQQAASLEETAAAVQEITNTVKKSAEGASEARNLTTLAKADAEKSKNVAHSAIEAMERIEKSSVNIGQIIGAIDEIAFQTNLLALNAGVEAARAGEAGKGFAVVASEVRALAQRSAEAAKEIKGLIMASTSEVSEGVNLVTETRKALERISAQVVEINGVVDTIAAGAADQSHALQQVNIAIAQMDQDTQKNAAMVEETTAASHSLRQEADKLSQSVVQFQITQSRRGEHAARRLKKDVGLKVVAAGGGSSAARRLGATPHAEDSAWQEF